MSAIRLSDHFNYGRLIKFTLPSILMMIFTSIYGMVDGYFVSNYIGKTEFAALNLIWPFPMVIGAIGYMFGAGGTALVSKTLGEGDREKASRIFSLIIYSLAGLGTLLGIAGLLLVRPVAIMMGASGELLEQAVIYGSIIMAGIPTFMLQCAFQPLMVTAERPKLGFWITLASGLTNMVADWLLIGVLGGGLEAAAAATVLSQVVGAAWPILFFALPNRSLLRFSRAERDFGALVKTCSNGMSEFVSNVALSLVSMIYNARLLALAGENGVSAYGVIMYVALLFLAVFFGYSMGAAPVISFHFGAGNLEEVRNIRRRSLVIQTCFALVSTGAAMVSARWIAGIFTGYDRELWELSTRAFRLYSLSFLLSHFNIFASAFFTALNDGITSAKISLSRMFIFQISAVLLLPLAIGLDGIWLAMPASEVCCCILSAHYYRLYSNRTGRINTSAISENSMPDMVPTAKSNQKTS